MMSRLAGVWPLPPDVPEGGRYASAFGLPCLLIRLRSLLSTMLSATTLWRTA
jgi:hypothetical protein